MQTHIDQDATNLELAAMLAKLQEAEQTEQEDNADVSVADASSFDENALLGALSDLSEATVDGDPTILTQEEIGGIEASEIRARVYSSQTDTTIIADPNVKVKVGKAKAATVKRVSKPRTERDLKSLPAETFVLLHGDDPDKTKAEVLAHPPTQTKVVEKWENLFVALAAGTKPSKFTVTGFTLLKSKGVMTSADLVTAMRAEGLRDGTARAQTGQIMALLPLIGVATRSGQTLTLRQDSVIAEKLTKILEL